MTTFKIKYQLENVAIVRHCNLRPPGLPPDPPRRTLAEKNLYSKSVLDAI